jgi:small subunit ribosomal protein S13
LAEEGAAKKDETKKGDRSKEEPKKGEPKEGKQKKEKGEAKKSEPKKVESKKDENFKYIVRLVNTDVDGNKPIIIGLQSVRGVGSRVAEVIVRRAGVDRIAKVGTLEDGQIETLENLITTYADYAPAWAVNRQLDFETGDDMHIVGVNMEISLKDDLNRMKMIRSYKGVRHEGGQKVRGQRTRSNGRTGLTLGVMRQRQAQPGGAAAPEGGKPEEKTKEKPAAGAKPAAEAKPAAAAPAAKPEAKK